MAREDHLGPDAEEDGQRPDLTLEGFDQAALDTGEPGGVDSGAGAYITEPEAPEQPERPERGWCVVHAPTLANELLRV